MHNNLQKTNEPLQRLLLEDYDDILEEIKHSALKLLR